VKPNNQQGEMNMVTTQITEKLAKFKIVRPLSLFISLIREIGGDSDKESEHKKEFKRMLLSDDYEDFRDAVIDEWMRIKYSTALGAALPTTALSRDKKSQKIHETDKVHTLKIKIVGKLLDVIMPNGKKLANCTGADCIRFGGWLINVGEVVGVTKVVGEILSEKELIKFMG
jgi:hypothetical protein